VYYGITFSTNTVSLQLGWRSEVTF